MDTSRQALAQLGQKTNLASVNMILVMGVTGAGKSYFINHLAGKTVVEEGADLKSCEMRSPFTGRI